MERSNTALRQQIPVTVIAQALKLEPGNELLVAPSTPFLTAATVAKALPPELAGSISMEQLSYGADISDRQGYPADYFDGTPIEDAPRLYNEPDAKGLGSTRPVLIDALECERIAAVHRSGRKTPDLPALTERLTSFVNEAEPGYLDLGDWGPYFWCLFARVMARGARAAVVLPAGTLEANESARVQLVRAGFIEQVIYIPILGNRHYYEAAVLILSEGNTSISFNDCSSMKRWFSPKKLEEPLGNRLDIAIANINKPIASYEVREILRNRAALSMGAVKSAALAHGYPTHLGQLFKRVPPFMPRESLCSDDIDAIPIRRISSRDFADGNLLPEKAVITRYREAADDPTVIKLESTVFERYGLKAGDIVMPRLLGRAEKINTLIVRPEDAEQRLVASHNTTVIRPACENFTDEERVAYSEMVAAYLTEGHGAELLEALSAGTGAGMRSVRPTQLGQIEIPPALDPRTDAYAEHANAYVTCVNVKRAAEAALAQATADLGAAKAAIAQELKEISS